MTFYLRFPPSVPQGVSWQLSDNHSYSSGWRGALEESKRSCLHESWFCISQKIITNLLIILPYNLELKVKRGCTYFFFFFFCNQNIFWYLLGFRLWLAPRPGKGTFFCSIRVPLVTECETVLSSFSLVLPTTLVTVVTLGPPLACLVTVVVFVYLTPWPLWIASAGATWLWLGKGVLVTWAPVCTAVELLTGCETGPFWNGLDSRTFRCDLFDKSLRKGVQSQLS